MCLCQLTSCLNMFLQTKIFSSFWNFTERRFGWVFVLLWLEIYPMTVNTRWAKLLSYYFTWSPVSSLSQRETLFLYRPSNNFVLYWNIDEKLKKIVWCLIWVLAYLRVVTEIHMYRKTQFANFMMHRIFTFTITFDASNQKVF